MTSEKPRIALSGVLKLMAHIGEETRLGAAGVLGEIARMDEIALMRLALGDIARHGDDVAHRIAGSSRGTAAEFAPGIAALLRGETELRGCGLALAGRRERGRHDVRVIGMSEIGQRAPDQFLGPVAEQSRRGRACVVDPSVDGVARDQIVGVLREEAVARFARLRRLVGRAVAFLGGDRHQGRLDDGDHERQARATSRTDREASTAAEGPPPG